MFKQSRQMELVYYHVVSLMYIIYIYIDIYDVQMYLIYIYMMRIFAAHHGTHEYCRLRYTPGISGPAASEVWVWLLMHRWGWEEHV